MKTKIFLFLAVLSFATNLCAMPLPTPEIVYDDPEVTDGNFGWWLATSENCLVSGAPGTETVSTFHWEGDDWVFSDRIFPPSAEAGAQFGRRLSISEDGRTLAVCAPHDDQFGTDAGVLFLFEGPGDCTFPTLVQTLKGSDTNEFDGFCSSVDFNSDGLALAVGASFVDKVYEFSRASLGQQLGSEKKFAYSGDDAGGFAGYSVCLDGTVASGNMLLAIGIPFSYNEVGGNDWFGAVDVREQNRGGANVWGSRNRVLFPDAERLGWSLGCSRGDNLVIAGAPIDMTAGGSSGFVPETTGQGRGAVYVTRLEGASSLSLVQKLISEDPQNDGEFGRVVSYDKFEKQLLVTAPFNDVGAIENNGRAQTYRWSGSSFVQKDTLVFPSYEFEEYGLSGVIFRGRAFIGSPFSHAGGLLDSGVVLAYYNPLFSDGFESGSTTAWSTTVP